MKAGEVVMVDIQGVQTEPHIWGADSTSFRPERVDPMEVQARPTLSWMPFGVVGVRS